MKIHYLYIVLLVASVLSACGQKKEQPVPAPAPPVSKVEMNVPSGTKAPATEPVDTIPGQTHFTVTCTCLGSTDPDLLDVLPRNLNTARRDTSLLRQINEGRVYVVKPGERGYILAKEGDRVQLRFPDKIVWVMVSDTK